MKGIEYMETLWPVQVYVALCVCPKAWDAEMKRLDVKGEPWPESSGGTTRLWRKGSNGRVCIVTINGYEARSPIEVAGLLVHEAVHVWQAIREEMKEREPGHEHEAYTVQVIAQRFFEMFNRMVGAHRLTPHKE